MAPATSIDKEVDASSNAAEAFATQYYDALNALQPILPFYINSSSRYNFPADITINGAVLSAPVDYFNLLESQGKDVFYEIESLDTHVLNPSFQLCAPDNLPEPNHKSDKQGGRMSLLVTTLGKVKYGKGRDAPVKMFNETFVLVPNWEAQQKNPPRGIKRWLIMSQNFRAL